MGTTNPAESHFLSRLVLHHSAFLKRLEVEMKRLPSEHATSPNYQFLILVLGYHEASNSPNPDWMSLYEGFTAFGAANQSMDDVLRFFILNYRFLTLRNADDNQDCIQELTCLSDDAFHAVHCGDPVNHLLYGFIGFNVARWEHGHGNVRAKETFMHAADRRLKWYHHVRNVREEFIVVTAAAEQVRKLPGAFQKMFPDTDTTELGISNELMAEVTAIAPGDREVK